MIEYKNKEKFPYVFIITFALFTFVCSFWLAGKLGLPALVISLCCTSVFLLMMISHNHHRATFIITDQGVVVNHKPYKWKGMRSAVFTIRNKKITLLLDHAEFSIPEVNVKVDDMKTVKGLFECVGLPVHEETEWT